MVVLAPAEHAGTWHSRPRHGPSSGSSGIGPRLGPEVDPARPPPDGPPLPLPPVPGAMPPTGLPPSLLEQESPMAPQHTTRPTARTWSIEAALIQRFMATPLSPNTHTSRQYILNVARPHP